MRTMGRASSATLLLVVLVATGFAGCLREVNDYYKFDPDAQYVNPGVLPGKYKAPSISGSLVLERRKAVVGDPEVYRVESSHPHTLGSGAASSESPSESTVYITIAAWIPTNGTTDKHPVLIDAGPFFEQDGESILNASRPQGRNGLARPHTIPFLLENYYPLGYAVAAVAIRGTGTSGGCMELMGPREAADLDQAISFLAEQDWSNGNVAMIGFDYDASAAWMGAALGNEHLRTIVPIAGTPDLYSMFYANGTARGAPTDAAVDYWRYGFSPDAATQGQAQSPASAGGATGREPYQDRQNLLCADAAEGIAMTEYSSTQGDRGATTFWTDRDYRQRVVSNYFGSVFLVHGLQDRIVEPRNIARYIETLRGAGVPTKVWLGQWDHARPDSNCQTDVALWIVGTCRWDFAETLRQWLDAYLEDNATAKVKPWTSIEDDRGYWRLGDTFPPAATWTELTLRSDKTLGDPSGPASRIRLVPSADQTVFAPVPPAPPGLPVTLPPFVFVHEATPFTYTELRSEPFPADARISGSIQLQLAFEPQGEQSVLAAWLMDENDRGRVLDRWLLPYVPYSQLGQPPVIDTAIMDLRYHQGGDTADALVPGQPYTALMEFEARDLLIPAGHRLTLWIFEPSNTASAPVDLVLGPGSTLRLPTITIDQNDVFPVPGAHFPDPRLFDRAHILKPDYDDITVPVR